MLHLPRQSRNSRLVLVLRSAGAVFALLALTGGVARSELIMFGECLASTVGQSNCVRNQIRSSTPIDVDSSASSFYPDDGYRGQASASASYAVNADYGRLGIDVSAAAASAVPAMNPSGAPQNARGNVNASASFIDSLTVVGGPLGTLATINFSIPVHGEFTQSAHNGTTQGQARVTWVIFEDAGAKLSEGCWLSNSGTGTCGSFPANAGPDIEGSFGIRVGAAFRAIVGLELIGVLAVSNGGVAGSGDTFTWVEGDASISGAFGNTVLGFFDPVDPTLSLVAASGHDYATPAAVGVPEPVMILLLLPGLAIAIGMRQRKESPAIQG